MALRGMPSNLAESSACTKTAPAFSLIERRPSVPSEPMPERITAMPRACWSSASERKKKSMGKFRPRGETCGKRWSIPCSSDIVLAGRDHVDVVPLDSSLRSSALRDRHVRRALEQLDEHSLVRRIEVLYDDECHASIGRDTLEKDLERLEAPAEAPSPTTGKAFSEPRRSSVAAGNLGRAGGCRVGRPATLASDGVVSDSTRLRAKRFVGARRLRTDPPRLEPRSPMAIPPDCLIYSRRWRHATGPLEYLHRRNRPQLGAESQPVPRSKVTSRNIRVLRSEANPRASAATVTASSSFGRDLVLLT